MKKNILPILLGLMLPALLQAQVKLLFNEYEPKQRLVLSNSQNKVRAILKVNDNIIPARTADNDRDIHFVKRNNIAVELNESRDFFKSLVLSPVPTLVFEPTITQTIDPHIAAGRNYLVITNYDDIGYFDKNGVQLAPKAGGLPTRLNADVFFGAFFDPINQEMGLSNKSSAYQINEFYDLRVIYDDNSRRFLIIAAARNQLWFNDPNTPDNMEPFARRLVAFAVSKTEDPRDGFYQYMTTENNYRDWPRISINGNHLMIANNAADGMGSGPVAYIISMNDVKTGKNAPAAVKLNTADFGFDHVNDVTCFDAPFTYSCFVRSDGKKLNILYFDKNASLQNKPTIKKAVIDLPDDVGSISNGAYIRNNNLYFVYHYVTTERVPDKTPARLKIRYVRIPLSLSNAGLNASKGNGYLHWGFGRNAVEDDPSDLVSYEEPSIAINKKGDFLMGYGRTGVKTKNVLYPEARYTIYYANEDEHRRSRVLHKGESLPTSVHEGETVATVKSHADYLHYSAASPDPLDNSFWIIHVYAGPNKSYRVVAGKIKP